MIGAFSEYGVKGKHSGLPNQRFRLDKRIFAPHGEFMIDGLIFGAIILVVIALVLLFGIGPKNIIPWGKTKAGMGAIASMVLGVVVVVVVGITVTLFTGLFQKADAQTILDNKYGHFLNNAYVFAGIDYTKNLSPQCVQGTTQDHLTSNMGMGVGLWQSPSKRVQMDLQWTHHSCVLGVDRNSYDGAGIRVTWYPWVRSSEPFKFTK